MRKKLLLFFVFVLQIIFLSAAKDDSDVKFDWSKNVVQNGGDVVIENIPQIAQKGTFCVAASMTMILQYYGERYSQSRIAGFFRSRKGGGGTSYARMDAAFSRGSLAKNYKLLYLYTLWWSESLRLLNAYEDYLRENPKKRVSRKRISKNWEAFDDIDPQIAREVFGSQRSDLIGRMNSLIPLCIDNGIPIFWALFMNLDPNDRSKGGHGRLIVGYRKNGERVSEIIYRDSWGKKVVLKRMSLKDAVVATNIFCAVLPKKSKTIIRKIEKGVEIFSARNSDSST